LFLVRHYYRNCYWALLLNGDLEKKLVLSCRGGDKSAYAGLVRAYSGRVFAICLGMVGHREDAEDLAQQALLKGFVDIKQLHRGENFGAWIGRIAKNLCIDFIRSQRRRRSAFAEQNVMSQSGSKEYPELESALTKLPQEQRLVLMLYYFDGQSTEKVAETLDISRSAVQGRMSRARRQLRKLLEAKGGV